jgi:hypothetical protein
LLVVSLNLAHYPLCYPEKVELPRVEVDVEAGVVEVVGVAGVGLAGEGVGELAGVVG